MTAEASKHHVLEITERSVGCDVGNSSVEQLMVHSKAPFPPLVDGSKAPQTSTPPPIMVPEGNSLSRISLAAAGFTRGVWMDGGRGGASPTGFFSEGSGGTGRKISSLSTTSDDDASSTNTEAMFIISPNGKFKRKIKSWMRGVLLGSGSFGMVYEGISDEGAFFAVKEVSLLDQGSNAQQSILALEQEIALLSQFEHENIVQYYGTDKEESKIYIFIELVTQGSLASLYQKYKLQDSQVSAYTRQILNGLVYLHERNVVHRDIKCANILVHANGSVKLADFGLAKEMSKINMLRSCKGSVYWMAPEVVNPKKTYGPPADIWSLGCTVLEMLTRQIPYPNVEWTNAFSMIGRGEQPPIPSYLSKEARDFIGQCVRVVPEERRSASQLLAHPFVNRPLRDSFESSSPPAISL